MRVEEEKVHVIPLGVDTKLFRPKGDKEQIRDELKLGRNAVVVGSFQKDGVGWGTGEQPKLIKGPDILVNVIKKLASRYQVHVLLVGPARGFVVKQLSEAGISFHNVGYLKNYRDIAKYYQALDLYLVTSRIEGGPKAILESWAAGVPLVSTTVGMVPDIATDGVNAFLSAVGDEESIYRQACALIEDSSLRASFARNGAQEVQKFTWDIIARRYYDEMYSHLL
jgi:glycosyltransferase involved in cell wall biosynthesis